MRYLGIDYGEKRVGIARSDEFETMTWPLIVLPNNKNLLEEVAKICADYNIEAVVIGESLDFEMKKNDIMKDIEPFGELLKKKTGLPVYLHPEFYTSIEGQRLQGRNDMLDASAAALVLQSYLDTKHTAENVTPHQI